MHILLLITAFISVVLVIPTASASMVQRADFANGVELLVEEDHSAPVAMLQVWLRVGGRDEPAGKTGMAHVLEHMMFKGSDAMQAGEFSKTIAAMGGRDNAFTSTDYTAYFETLPATKVEQVLRMEAERFANLNLDAEDFAKEIEVIKEERRLRTDDDPNSRLFEELSAAALRLHPYRNPVIGWMQDLQNLNINDVRAFYEKYYVPGKVIVVVVGDVKFNDMRNIVAETFGKQTAKPVPKRFSPTEPEPLGEKQITVHLPAESPLYAVVLPVPVWQPGINDKQAAALAVLTHMLSAGRSAILKQVLVDKQRLAFEVAAGYDPFGMGLDLWYAYAVLAKKQSVQELEKGFWSLLRNMEQQFANKKLEEENLALLKSSKQRMIAGEVFASDSLYLRARRIGGMEVRGIDALKYDDWLQALRGVSIDDIHQVINKWLLAQRASTGILRPVMPTTAAK
ncbi:MAG: pitrilysin family protein [Mariprofundales bacterium]